LNCGKAFQPLFLHWSLLVGAISTGAVSDEVKVSVNVAAPDEEVIAKFTADVPSSWKFPPGVWIVAVYGTPERVMLKFEPLIRQAESLVDLLPVIVVVPELIVKVALVPPPPGADVPDSENVPG
jgi:hypothetical protein